MRIASVSALCCLLGVQRGFASPLSRDANTDLTVDLGYGLYQGAHNASTSLNVWKGIRYAAPPVGHLRWQPPATPPTSRSTVVNATAFGPACPQAPNAPAVRTTLENSREDCLFLNVYAPPTESGKLLPVLVWIHGGGYGAGNGRQDMSTIINANDNKFVAVAIQYRVCSLVQDANVEYGPAQCTNAWKQLGAFGFLSSEDVAADGVVNAGILDQAFALQWIQDHIAKFGGDRDRVTISGESAGGGAVMLLTTGKSGTLGTSLFRNAIAASPYLPPQYDYNASVPTQKYRDFASTAGCSNATDVLNCLRSKNSTTLQSANGLINSAAFYGNWAFLPVTDYDFIASLPSQALAQKEVNGEHVMVGNNADEGSGFVPQNITTRIALESWMRGNFPSLDSATIQQVLAVYRTNSAEGFNSTAKFATPGFGSAANALNTSPVGTGIQQLANNMYAEATFICPSYWLSDAFTSQNRTSFHYQYSIPVALHASDVSAYFGPTRPYQPAVFTSAFRHIWGLQIERAAPSLAPELSVENVAWPAWVPGSTSQMLNLNVTGGTLTRVEIQKGVFATESLDPGLKNSFSTVNAKTWEAGRGERCAVWHTIAAKVPF